ncbi:MAG: VOC family protein [Bacteroidota bacterium]
MIHPLPDPTSFLTEVFDQLAELKLDVSALSVDHLCYRVESMRRYFELREAIAASGHQLINESVVNGRLISCFRLSAPIIFQNREIPLLELPAPKAGSHYVEGYEHLEFVVGSKLEEWQQKLLAIENQEKLKKDISKGSGEMEQFEENSDLRKSTFNPSISLKLGKGLRVKFHERPLDEVIAFEQETDILPPTNIAIFVSGTGSNARVMIDRFKDHNRIRVALLVSNKRKAPALMMAAERGVPTLVVGRNQFYDQPDFLLNELGRFHIQFIVLAGFLWLIPAYLIRAYPKKMVNIHPALLPKYGGKGMYGMHVHRAVAEAGETESGLSIHYVNEQYDEGNIIFQARTRLLPEDGPEEIASKVLKLEHEHYGQIVEDIITG